jgi:CheY-like chemotaxis protein
VRSERGRGSAFRLVLPRRSSVLEPAPAVPRGSAPIAEAPQPPVSGTAPAPRVQDDDRERIAAGARSILIIEDDERFARILSDLAHEQGFQCLATETGAEGLELARRFLPKAIVLDINLPDGSGLSILERLKRDRQTRHIPVHVVSVLDFSQRAYELGAVGYALKPVRREELVAAFRKLEQKFEQVVGRVLLVEDVDAQRESLLQLLRSDSVEITAVGDAASALEQLRKSTFDCMVLDLGLPDMSGYELLERISEDGAFSFPPVIIYTGRNLSPDEEVRLRRYSSSVVIKGARSPERLLDEVTLFLHRVESSLPREQQRMLRDARNREAIFEGRRVLLVEDDVRNIFALTSILEPRGATIEIARNGREALVALERGGSADDGKIDIVLMDIMMPEMDGLTAMREIRKRSEWTRLPIIALTAKATSEDRELCVGAGANDYIAKPIDVDRLLSLIRVWMPR